MMGVASMEAAPDAEPEGKPWTRVDKRSKKQIPGLETRDKERYVYVQLLPDENIELMMKRLCAFIRVGKKEGKFEQPTGGGISSNHWDNWQIRIPTGQALVPWHIAGYECRPNAEHLIQANLEAWQSIAREFARASRRKIAAISDGKTLVVRGGGQHPISRLEYRRFKVD
jgi:hypothetical protein